MFLTAKICCVFDSTKAQSLVYRFVICLEITSWKDTNRFSSRRYFPPCERKCVFVCVWAMKMLHSCERNPCMEIVFAFSYISISTRVLSYFAARNALIMQEFSHSTLCRYDSAFTLMPQCDSIHLLTAARKNVTSHPILRPHSAWLWREMICSFEWKKFLTAAMFSTVISDGDQKAMEGKLRIIEIKT